MFRYFLKSVVGHFRGGKSLHLLTIIGVAIGVASVISIHLISSNAISAFAGTVRAVSGDADLTVLGATGYLPDTTFPTVVSTHGVRVARPVFRSFATLVDEPQGTLEILGVDLLAPAGVPVEGVDGLDPFGMTGWVAVSPRRARENGWTLGDTVAVLGGGKQIQLVIGATIDFQSSDQYASSSLAVMDIAQAQSLFGGIGRLHQIDVSVRAGTNPDTVATNLQTRIGASLRVITPERRVSEAADLLEGFRLNLTALSLVSVFVGLFLVYSSTQAGLVRRRKEHGVLRCLGASRSQLIMMVFAEVGLLGLIGVTIGMPLGYWAAVSRIDVVNTTITNLYLLQAVERVYLETPTIWFAIAAGVGGALVGAIIPAIDISRRDTRSLLTAYVLRDTAAHWAPKLFVAGITAAIAVGIWFGVVGRIWRPSGFVLAFTVVMVLPLITPYILDRTVRRVQVNSFGWSISVKTLAAHLHTTSLTVAALGVAVTILVGVTIMVTSFRMTLERWIDSTVNADVYIAAGSGTPGFGVSSIDDAFVMSIASRTGVVATDRLRRGLVSVSGRRIPAMAVDAPNPANRSTRFALIEGSVESVFAENTRNVLISEPLARKQGVWTGDTIGVTGAQGTFQHPIAGVYYEYGNESGTVVMSQTTFAMHFESMAIQGLAIYLQSPDQADDVAAALRLEFAELPIAIRSNRLLRDEALSIFDQTFAITRLLRTMTLVIAIAGITLTLLVLTRERISELALYRALGGTPRQTFRIFLGKGIGLASFGFLLGTLGGISLALVLVYIINRAYFGWTIQLFAPWGQVISQFVIVLLAASIASLYPAWKASKASANALSRENV